MKNLSAKSSVHRRHTQSSGTVSASLLRNCHKKQEENRNYATGDGGLRRFVYPAGDDRLQWKTTDSDVSEVRLASFNAPKRAFTLVEVLIAVTIFTMVIGGTMAAFLACNKLWQSTSLAMQASREANNAMSRIIYGLGTNDGLRTASQVNIDTVCAGVYRYMYPPTSSSFAERFAETNYPVPATANNHWVASYSTGDGSWRMVVSNYNGRVTWIDYNINARNIVFWPDITDHTGTTRESIANYVSAATATVTNGGLELSMTIERRNGNLLTTNNVNTFIRLRNM